MGLSIPQKGIAQAHQNPIEESKIVFSGHTTQPEDVQDSFDNLKDIIEKSENPIKEGKKILEALLNEINSQHGSSLTTPQICQWTKENIHLFKTNENTQLMLLEAIQLFETEILEEQNNPYSHSASQNLPEIFYKNKKVKNPATTYPVSKVLKNEAHTDLIASGVEVLAGAAIMLAVGWTGPGSIIAGIILADGFHRIVNDGIATGRREKENRERHPTNDGGTGLGIGMGF